MTDTSHTNAFDFKRKHTASLFLPFVSVIMSEVHLTTAQVTIRFINPQPQSAMSLELQQGDTLITQVVIGGDDLDVAKTTPGAEVPGSAKVLSATADSITLAFSATVSAETKNCPLTMKVKWIGASSIIGDSLGDEPITIAVELRALSVSPFGSSPISPKK
jgi:hypothetical protein